MTARVYEFYLRVFEHKEIKFISTSLLYKHQINSCEKGAIYYVTITTVISSRVMLSSRVKI